MPSRFQPALLGGVLIGVLSALPVVNAGNCCCCLWVVCGGLLTVYLQQSRMDAPIEMSDAVISGLLAGITGAIVCTVINMALSPLLGPYQARMMQYVMERVQEAVPNLPPDTIQQMDQ